MIKREFGKSVPKGFVLVTNAFAKCLCGSHFDSDGVCNNKHFKGHEYYVPKNKVMERLEKKNVPVDTQVCRSFGSRCNICGAMIPEGDNICDNGHMLGVKYLNN